MASRLARVALALVLGAGVGTIASTTTAFAAACPAGTGVSVVVNSSVSCDANGGGTAASNFGDAGQSLSYARRQPGFVCRVNGAPSSDPCVNTSPADAYWGLFWSDGKSGKWTYSSLGVQSLKVPAGGWVAFKFQSSNSTSYPTVTPVTKTVAKPQPTRKPATVAPPATNGSSATTPAAKAEAKKAEAKKQAKAKAAAKSTAPSASPSASASAQAAESAELERASQETDGPSSTVWAGGLLALALVVGMAVTIWQRRSRHA